MEPTTKSEPATNVKRPLLRYFGGKWQLRHWIIEHFPEHQFYAEPFAGAASVLLAKQPAPGGEIINDLNGDVINLFRVMQDRESADELERRLKWTPYAKSEHAAAAESSEDPVEKARRMLIRSFMGIEGAGVKSRGTTGFRMGNVDLSRVDQCGQRTFRNCAKDWNNWKEQIGMIRDRLSEVMIYERDAIEFIGLMDSPDCLFYVDPPYHHETRSKTRYEVEFSTQEHIKLIERLAACKARVVLSGYTSAIYGQLELRGWELITKDYRANMSAKKRVECLWISPNAQIQ